MTGVVAGTVVMSKNHTAWQSLDCNSDFMTPGPVVCLLDHTGSVY